MAVSEEIVASLVEAVAALNQRVNDAAMRQMMPGPPGEPGPQGEPGKDAPPVSDQQIKDAAVAWLEANITQPQDGAPGEPGKPGENGRAPTPEEIRLAVEVWFEIHRDELVGPAGRDGTNGTDGRDGVDGRNGRDGRDGIDGVDGVGISLVEQRDETSFWITLTDGQEFQIELPKPKQSVMLGGGGGGGSSTAIQSIASSDGSVTVSTNGTAVDLSVSGTGATTNVVALVRNRTGQMIPKGTAVYISGATGQTSDVSLALATSDATCAQTLGLTTTDIANNATGYVLTFGYLTDINTNSYTNGQQLYLSTTVAGGLTGTKPHAPGHMVYMAVVEYAHAIHGKLFVKVQNGYELDELHDVLITSPANGDVLQYDATSHLWKNGQIAVSGNEDWGLITGSPTSYDDYGSLF